MTKKAIEYGAGCGLRRKSIKLESGEVWVGQYKNDPPEGCRWETDDELKERMLEIVRAGGIKP